MNITKRPYSLLVFEIILNVLMYGYIHCLLKLNRYLAEVQTKTTQNNKNERLCICRKKFYTLQ